MTSRPERLREYQAYRFRERKPDGVSVVQKPVAPRFFFIKTLPKPRIVAHTPGSAVSFFAEAVDLICLRRLRLCGANRF